MSNYVTYIDNYNDLSNLARFYVEVDKLYDFREKNPSEVSHVNSGLIVTSQYDEISGIYYSNTKSDKLYYKSVYKNLEEEYVVHLKTIKVRDTTIPDKVWNKYKASDY